jgi:hypothetical protein
VAANINSISEDDFTALASAAQRAKDAGKLAEAEALDKLARKANAALTNAKYSRMGSEVGFGHKGIGWRQVPSTLC